MVATVDISLVTVSARGKTGASLPVIDPIPVDTDLLTSSASSQQSDFAVPSDANGMVWQITVTGDKIRAKFGANPTAVAAEDGGFLLLDGRTAHFAAVPGHKVAVITA